MALSCTWGGYADTDVDFTEFFNADHTIAVRFMLQYPNAYTGPMLSLNGTGTYLIGQGDFLADPRQQAKLIMNIGTGQVTYSVSLPAGTWHHLAVVRSSNLFQMYLDGQPVGSSLTVPATDLPAGMLRFGKNTYDAAVDGGGAQFYGLLDDVAIFQQALPAYRIAELASALHLTGSEEGLYAGYVFGYIPSDTLPPVLARPLKLTPAANIIQISPDRNNAADAALLPLGLTSLAHLPFPPGLALSVIQGYDNPKGSHQGYASFCLDLILAGQPQSASNGQPFYAAAPGVVDFVKQDGTSGGAMNFISIQQASLEFCDYLHLAQNSAQVQVGDSVTFQQYLANIGDTGVLAGAYHLHIAVTNLGEGHKNSGGSFVTIPSPYANYDVSDDQGSTWRHVLHGVPQEGQWIRRPLDVGPVRYTAVWQPSTECEIQVYGWTYQDYRAKYDELWPQGWRLKLLDVYVLNNQEYYTAVWHPSTEGEIQVYGWSYQDYRAKYDELWPKGWRLKLLDVYVINGQERYTAVWRPSTEGEIQVYGWTYQDYRAKYDELWPQGWRLKLLDVYVVNDQERYTAVWQPSTEGEIQVYGWTYQDYRAKYDELWPQGWRLKLLDVYIINGQEHYTAAWSPATGGEIQVYDWVYDDYRARYDVLWQYGWRLKLLDVYAV